MLREQLSQDIKRIKHTIAAIPTFPVSINCLIKTERFSKYNMPGTKKVIISSSWVMTHDKLMT
jgi:hypothetical protein